MEENSDLRSYLRAVAEAPISIIFALLDLAAIVGVFLWVVDDAKEAGVLLVFVVVTHVGHYLIFRRERSRSMALRSRLAELEIRRPDLSLEFSQAGAASSHLDLSAGALPLRPNRADLVEKERGRLLGSYESAFRDHEAKPALKITERMSLLVDQLKSRDQYADEVEKYLVKFEEFLDEEFEFERSRAWLRSASFELTNGGTVPAHDIRAFVHFPTPFRFPSEEELIDIELNTEKPELPAPPKPIATPMSEISRAFDIFNTSVSMPALPSISDTRPNVRGPYITPSKSTQVSYEIDKLQHGFAADLGEVLFFVTEELLGQTWHLEYEIHSSDLPVPESGRLAVRIEGQNSS